MKRRLVIPPCELGILSLVRVAVEWCLSLLFHAGTKQRNALDGQGFQPSQKAHYPCICENHPASSEWRGDHRPEFKPAALPQARSPGNAEREPRNGVEFTRDGVGWFLLAQFHKPDRGDLKTDALVSAEAFRDLYAWTVDLPVLTPQTPIEIKYRKTQLARNDGPLMWINTDQAARA